MPRHRILALMLVAAPLSAQPARPTTSKAIEKSPAAVDSGPTMEQTKQWLEEEGILLMHALAIQNNRLLTTSSHKVTALKLDSCRLSWRDSTISTIWDGDVNRKPDSTRHSSSSVVPLKDLDVGGVHVFDMTIMTDKPVQILSMKTRASVGPTIMNAGNDDVPKPEGVASLYVTSKDAGERLIRAIRRAAILCGAPASPF